jgi:4a-hydroxytetrahydrobiopterin dehydratase
MSWTEKNKTLMKTFELNSFSAIIECLNDVAEKANEMGHHPDFEVFGYKNIRFSLSTHDANGITEKDHELAKKIDAIFE